MDLHGTTTETAPPRCPQRRWGSQQGFSHPGLSTWVPTRSRLSHSPLPSWIAVPPEALRSHASVAFRRSIRQCLPDTSCLLPRSSRSKCRRARARWHRAGRIPKYRQTRRQRSFGKKKKKKTKEKEEEMMTRLTSRQSHWRWRQTPPSSAQSAPRAGRSMPRPPIRTRHSAALSPAPSDN